MTEPRALVKNAADPKQVEDAQRKEKDATAQSIADMRATLELPAGRRMLWRLLDYCAPLESPSRGGSASNEHTRENIGRGDVGRYLIAEIATANPEAYPQMMLDAYQENERANRNARSTGSRKPADSNVHSTVNATESSDHGESDGN